MLAPTAHLRDSGHTRSFANSSSQDEIRKGQGPSCIHGRHASEHFSGLNALWFSGVIEFMNDEAIGQETIDQLGRRAAGIAYAIGPELHQDRAHMKPIEAVAHATQNVR